MSPYLYNRKGIPNQETFIKHDYVPGSVREFDWGEVKLYIGGKSRRFYMAAFTSAYSNYGLSIKAIQGATVYTLPPYRGY